jgi:hypothetical protein
MSVIWKEDASALALSDLEFDAVLVDASDCVVHLCALEL